MRIDWKRNNKVCIRNFTEGTDLHDLIKTMLVRLLRRKNKNAKDIPIYTEYSPDNPSDEFPDIWMKIRGRIIVFEIQRDVSTKWLLEVQKRYEAHDLIIVPTKVVEKKWIANLQSMGPSMALARALDDYVV